MMTHDANPAADSSALVLFSGGQDSTTCLAWALAHFARVETVGFDYGQRHRIELAQRAALREGLAALSPLWRARLREDHTVSLEALGALSETALTREAEIALREDGLPNTFVPGRNLIFLTFAAALAYRRSIADVVGGMCETDYSGYPDCRHETIRAMNRALSLGMAADIEIHTPLMWIDKAGTWRMARDLGGEGLVQLIIEESHTCYLGERGKRFEWGYGCGGCPSCKLRGAGWEKYAATR
jgi:7-cyano-7-deazaguanine synthase